MAKIALCTDCKKRSLECTEIELLKANGRYSLVFLPSESIFSDKSLWEWELELEESLFVRVHRSYIVNLAHIKSVGNTVILNSGTIVPLAKRWQKEFESKYQTYLINRA